MRARLKQASIRFISIAICIFMLISNSGAAVLCIGQDGHVAIEVAIGDCCDRYSEASAETSANRHTDADYVASGSSCGNCIDIPLGGDYLTRQANSTLKKPSPFKVLARSATPLYNSDSVGTYEEYVTRLGNSVANSLRSIRTTVLLI